MTRIAYFALVLAASGLTGCDLIYGIEERADMTTSPDSACIINALQRAPGVSEVSEMHRSSQGIVIIGNGPKQGSTIDYYLYRVGPSRMQQATLTIEQFPGGHYRYSDEMLSMRQRIPYAQIAIALPVMDTAMHNIAAARNITALRE